MALSDRIASLRSSAERQLRALSSTKKTENALVLPFFEALGYDPFNVREVEPDFELSREDHGTRRADYALKKGGDPSMLVQCVEAKTNLDVFEDHFLLGSLDAVGATVAAFTNGLTYRFYADLQTDFVFSSDPFLEFNLLDYGPEQVEALKRLTKPAFEREQTRSVAYQLQSSQLLREYLAGQAEAPDDPFIRFLAAQVHEGEVSDELLDRFRPVVQNVLREIAEEEEGFQSSPAGSSEQPSSARHEVANEKKDSAPSVSEEEVVLTPSTKKSFPNETSDNKTSDLETSENEKITEDVEDPFEKDLATRVIEEF